MYQYTTIILQNNQQKNEFSHFYYGEAGFMKNVELNFQMGSIYKLCQTEFSCFS